MRKVSQNVVFCVLIVFTLNVCVMEPMSFNAFLEDTKVVEIIEKGAGKVYLTSDSEGRAGSGKITGLESGKYYMIERWDEGTPEPITSASTDIKFVSTAGTRGELNSIGRLSGSEITGLTNDNIYRVTSAKPLPITNFSHTSEVSFTKAPGKITLTDTGANTSMTISGLSGNYVTLPISPSGSTTGPDTVGNITTKGAGTTTDYVFYNTSSGNSAFYELEVVINTSIPITLSLGTITFAQLTDTGTTLVITNTTFSRAAFEGAGVTLTATLDPGFTFVEWVVEGTTYLEAQVFSSAATPELVDKVFDGNKLNILLRVTYSTNPYSKPVEITVVP